MSKLILNLTPILSHFTLKPQKVDEEGRSFSTIHRSTEILLCCLYQKDPFSILVSFFDYDFMKLEHFRNLLINHLHLPLNPKMLHNHLTFHYLLQIIRIFYRTFYFVLLSFFAFIWYVTLIFYV